MGTLPQQQFHYSEAEFDQVETEMAVWLSIRSANGWPAFQREVQGILFAWRNALESHNPEGVARTQGMIVGARAVSALVDSRIEDCKNRLQMMRAGNENSNAEE